MRPNLVNVNFDIDVVNILDNVKAA